MTMERAMAVDPETLLRKRRMIWLAGVPALFLCPYELLPV